jgi:hypothetical protein
MLLLKGIIETDDEWMPGAAGLYTPRQVHGNVARSVNY